MNRPVPTSGEEVWVVAPLKGRPWPGPGAAVLARIVPQFSHATEEKRVCVDLYRQCARESQAGHNADLHCYLYLWSRACAYSCRYATHACNSPQRHFLSETGKREKKYHSIAFVFVPCDLFALCRGYWIQVAIIKDKIYNFTLFFIKMQFCNICAKFRKYWLQFCNIQIKFFPVCPEASV